MQRTRKRQHLGTEAIRLAELGLSPTEVAAKLGVNRSTVHRWMVAGHVPDTRDPRDRPDAVPAVPAVDPLTVDATTWAAAIRAAYPLDATDAKLVDLADLALTVAQNAAELPSIRLAAVGRFQSVVKQLATRIRATTDDRPPAPVAAPPTARVDPRTLLNPTIQ